MFQPFDGACLGHALSKVCLYVTTNDKVAWGLNYVSIKFVQTNIQKCITWFLKMTKGKRAWEKTWIDCRLRPIKLNMWVKTK